MQQLTPSSLFAPLPLSTRTEGGVPDAEGVPEGHQADALHESNARVGALQRPHRLLAGLEHQVLRAGASRYEPV